MITLFVIGILVLIVKIVALSVKATFGMIKGVLLVIGIPALLVVLFVAGLIFIAIPLLAIALLAVFLYPLFKKR